MLVVLLWAACAAPKNALFPPEAGAPSKPVYIVHNGWHASFVVRREDVPPPVWPESGDFPEATYLEVGWGDKDYYMSSRFNLWYAFKALFWPTRSVLHIVGFNEPLSAFFPESEIVQIDLAPESFARLCDTVHDSYAHDDRGRTIPLGPGRYGNSLFYLSDEKYHLFKTSNVWTARALRSAGVPVHPGRSITAGGLAAQVRRFGRLLPEPGREDRIERPDSPLPAGK